MLHWPLTVNPSTAHVFWKSIVWFFKKVVLKYVNFYRFIQCTLYMDIAFVLFFKTDYWYTIRLFIKVDITSSTEKCLDVQEQKYVWKTVLFDIDYFHISFLPTCNGQQCSPFYLMRSCNVICTSSSRHV